MPDRPLDDLKGRFLLEADAADYIRSAEVRHVGMNGERDFVRERGGRKRVYDGYPLRLSRRRVWRANERLVVNTNYIAEAYGYQVRIHTHGNILYDTREFHQG
jgi:hypothetical protein